jgi:hypothetical protein
MLALRLARRPPAFDASAFTVSFAVLRLLPLVMLLLIRTLYFPQDLFEKDPPPVNAPVAVGCVIWAVAVLLPLQKWLAGSANDVEDTKHETRCVYAPTAFRGEQCCAS